MLAEYYMRPSSASLQLTAEVVDGDEAEQAGVALGRQLQAQGASDILAKIPRNAALLAAPPTKPEHS